MTYLLFSNPLPRNDEATKSFDKEQRSQGAARAATMQRGTQFRRRPVQHCPRDAGATSSAAVSAAPTRQPYYAIVTDIHIAFLPLLLSESPAPGLAIERHRFTFVLLHGRIIRAAKRFGRMREA